MALFLIIHNFKAVQRRVNPNQQVPQGGITRVYYIAITQSDRFLYTDLLMLYFEYLGGRSMHVATEEGMKQPPFFETDSFLKFRYRKTNFKRIAPLLFLTALEIIGNLNIYM